MHSVYKCVILELAIATAANHRSRLPLPDNGFVALPMKRHYNRPGEQSIANGGRERAKALKARKAPAGASPSHPHARADAVQSAPRSSALSLLSWVVRSAIRPVLADVAAVINWIRGELPADPAPAPTPTRTVVASQPVPS